MPDAEEPRKESEEYDALLIRGSNADLERGGEVSIIGEMTIG